MEDQIHQSFKVQWLNTTLKFIKNDDQLVLEYPEMEVTHVEYLHNIIWKRKNHVGFGFKSLYASVWEAMTIFSLKYKFKVEVIKSVDGQKGRLIIEKIPKKSNSSKEEPYLDEKQGKNNKESHKAESKHSEYTKQCPNLQCINKKSLRKSERYLVDKRKLIDSISPAFLRRTLQSILNFINSTMEASIVFSDLAPIESTFLENFLGIYNRRKAFEALFTPDCNEILEKIYKSFKEFSQSCKLEICAAKYDYKTKKREVLFLKVPRYKQISYKKTLQNDTSVPTENIANNTDTSDNVLTHVSDSIQNKEALVLKSTIVYDEYKPKVPKVDAKSTDRIVREEKMKAENKEKEDIVKEISTLFLSDPFKRVSNSASNVKGVIKNPQSVSNGLMMNKPIHKTKSSPRKAKLLEALSTPMKSEKATRMMHLMGWDGGALGMRGDGITEPIIPELNLTSRAGLGHEDENPERKKKTKPIDNRIHFLEEILNLLKSDMSVSVIKYETMIAERVRKCFMNAVDAINIRCCLELTPKEKSLLKEIKKIMMKISNIFLSLEFSTDFREVTITKLLYKVQNRLSKEITAKQKAAVEPLTSTNVVIDSAISAINKEPLVKTPFKKYVCGKILKFLQSPSDEEVVTLNQGMGWKNLLYVENVCACVNGRKKVPYNVEDVVFGILDNTGDYCLGVEFGVNGRSFLLFKSSYENQYIPGAIIRNENEQNKDMKILMNSDNKENAKENIDIVKSDIKNEIKGDIEQKQTKYTVCKNSTDDERLYTPKIELTKVTDLQGDIRNLIDDVNTQKELVKEIQDVYLDYDNNVCVKEVPRANAVQNLNSVIETISEICIIDKLKDDRQWYKRSEHFLTSKTLLGAESSKDNTVVNKINDNILNTENLNTSSIPAGHCIEEAVKREISEINNEGRQNFHIHLIAGSVSKNIDLNNNKKNIDDVKDNKAFIKDENINSETVLNEDIFENTDNGSLGGIVTYAGNSSNKNEVKYLCKQSIQVDEISSVNDTSNCYNNIILKSNIYSNDFHKTNKAKVQNEVNSILESQEKYTNVKDVELENTDEKEVETQDKGKSKECNNETSVTHIINKELSNTNKRNDNDTINDEVLKENTNLSVVNNKLTYENTNCCTKYKQNQLLYQNNEESINFHVLNGKNVSEDGQCYDIVVIKYSSKESSAMLKEILQKNLESEKDFLPSLKCHSCFDSGIIYSCHNKGTRLWLQNIFGEKVTDYKKKYLHHKLMIRIGNFCQDKQKILNFLYLYNSGLKNVDWSFDSNYLDSLDNNLVFMVGMDDVSFKYVCDHNFSLWAGFDRAYFTIMY